MTAIILRKDFQRIRMRVKSRIRKGKIQAELEEACRVERVIDELRDDVDFYNWNKSRKQDTRLIIAAIIKEWGSDRYMVEDEIVRRFGHVLTVGTIRIMQERGEIEMECDSYGRKRYRTRS